MIRPLRVVGGVLELLDQRALPGEERWLRCEQPEDAAEAIRTLAVRGAPSIGVAAGWALALAAQAGRDVEETTSLLASTRPTAVNLSWALGRVRRAHDAGGPEAALAEAEAIEAEQLESNRRLSALGAERFQPGDRVLTHCNAGALATGGHGTAGGVISEAWRDGRLELVWVDETRPLLQGARLTAWELENEGIPFRVVADSAVGALMERGLVDRVVVGADRIAANGDVANKVGTYPVAVLAQRHGVPFYVAAPVSTLDPGTDSGDEIPIEERDPAEVAADAPAFNPAFDVTPAELVSAIFTEAGVLEPPYREAIARAAGR